MTPTQKLIEAAEALEKSRAALGDKYLQAPQDIGPALTAVDASIATLRSAVRGLREAGTYTDSTPHLSVGDSAFEPWFEGYNPAGKSDKQRARDAYAAGMGDPLVVAREAGEPVALPCKTYETASGDHTICQTCGETWRTGKANACLSAAEVLRKAALLPPAPQLVQGGKPSDLIQRMYEEAAQCDVFGITKPAALLREAADALQHAVNMQAMDEFAEAVTAGHLSEAEPLTLDQIGALEAGCGHGALHWDTRVSLVRATERAHGIGHPKLPLLPREETAQPAQDGGEAVALPHPASPAAEAAIEAALEERNWPCNPKNAARAGWEAARKALGLSPAAPLGLSATPPAAEPVAAEPGAVSGERAAFVQEVMTLAENIADAEHAGPTVRFLHRRFLREFLERAALSAQPQKAGRVAVALTDEQKANAAWGYVEDYRRLSESQIGLIESVERASWAANGLTAPEGRK